MITNKLQVKIERVPSDLARDIPVVRYSGPRRSLVHCSSLPSSTLTCKP